MDHAAFDRMARHLGARVSRRAGLAGGVIAAVAAVAAGGETAARKKRAKPEGPCGDGSGKDNACKKDSQCCTGFCDLSLKTKHGGGRCRCVQRGRPCMKKSICCKNHVCGPEGTCVAQVKTGWPCTTASVCLSPEASCATYFSGNPAGTKCLMANGAACAANADCRSKACVAGVCAAETCTVCANGCPSSSIGAAITAAADGDVITIAEGTWTARATFDKSIEIRACNGGAVMILNGAGFGLEGQIGPQSMADGFLQLEASAPRTVVLRDLAFDGDLKPNTVGVAFYSQPAAASNVTVSGCAFQGFTQGAVATQMDGSIVISQTTFTGNLSYSCMLLSATGNGTTPLAASIIGCTVTGGSANNEAVQFNEAVAVIRDSVISGNSNLNTGVGTCGGGVRANNSTLTVAGETRITGNNAPVGAGLCVSRTVTTIGPVTIEPTVRITGNAGADGPGIVRWLESGGTAAITGANNTTVNGNTGGDQCDDFDGTTFTAVPNCAFA